MLAELSTKDADQLQFSLILEPDSLGNLITSMSVDKCSKAADAYREATAYARTPNTFNFLSSFKNVFLNSR